VIGRAFFDLVLAPIMVSPRRPSSWLWCITCVRHSWQHT